MELKKLFKPVGSMDADEARAFMEEREEGTYTLLDVRQPGEYEEEHIPGARLIPLPELNDSLEELDPEKPIIVHCAIGGRSRVAAQLLSGQGFKEVYNLKGGIKAWKGHTATGPEELNLDLVRGDETPGEMIRLAYGMEKGLQIFYRAMKEKAEDKELADFYSKMVEVEELHKKMLFELQVRVEPPGQDREAFEAATDSHIMEGGFNMSAFMERNAPFLHAFPDVIDVAMTLETQALDLYLRFAEKNTKSETKQVLFKISREEKRHLELLGTLLEERKKK